MICRHVTLVSLQARLLAASSVGSQIPVVNAMCLAVQHLSPGSRPPTGVTDSQVALAAHQVRIHASSGSSIFLDIGSNPIIEHCSAMGFAALTPQQQDLLSMPGAPEGQVAAAASASAAGGPARSDSSCAGAAAEPQPTDAAASAVGSGSSNCWCAVQDFNWLRSTPSPNW
jgi:Tubulin binding cofactor C